MAAETPETRTVGDARAESVGGRRSRSRRSPPVRQSSAPPPLLSVSNTRAKSLGGEGYRKRTDVFANIRKSTKSRAIS